MTYFQETRFTQREQNLIAPLGLNAEQLLTLDKNKDKVLRDRETLDLLANIRRACGQRQSLDILCGPTGLGSCGTLLQRFESQQACSTFGLSPEPAITDLGERPRRPEGLQEQGTIPRATPGLDRRDNTLNNVRQQTDAERVAAEVAARGAPRSEQPRIRAEVRRAVESAGPPPAPSRDSRIDSATAFIRPGADRERPQQKKEKETETARRDQHQHQRDVNEQQTRQNLGRTAAERRQAALASIPKSEDSFKEGLNDRQKSKFDSELAKYKADGEAILNKETQLYSALLELRPLAENESAIVAQRLYRYLQDQYSTRHHLEAPALNIKTNTKFNV